MDASPSGRSKDEGDIELRELSSPEYPTGTTKSDSNNSNNNTNNNNNDNDNNDRMNNYKGVSKSPGNNGSKYTLVGDNPTMVDAQLDNNLEYENGDTEMGEVTGHFPTSRTPGTGAVPGLNTQQDGHDDGGGYNDDNNDGVEEDAWSRPVVVNWKRQLLSTWYIFIVVLTPILLLPLILIVDDTYQKEARCGYVIAIMAVYWTTEALPISITALLPVVLLPMLGVMSARDTSGAFFNDVSMVFVGGLLVAIAIEVWDVHKRIALLTVRTVGAEPKLLLLGITLVTWFLSMWISNTATTAMMMTIVQALLDQYKEVYRQRDAKKAGISSDESLRLPAELSPESDKEYKRLCKAVCLTVAYAANIGGTGSLTGTGPNIIFFGAAQELFESKGLRNPVSFGTWMAYAVPMSMLLAVIQWAWMVLLFLRCKGGWPCCFRRRRGGSDDLDQVDAVIQREYRKLGPVSYAQKTIFVTFFFMVLCWVSRDLGGSGGWGEWFPPKTVSDSTSSIFFGILMFVLPSRPLRLCGKGGWKGQFLQIKPLLNWNHVQDKMPWSLYLVLGGGYAIARAATKSGLSAWLGEQLLVFKDLNDWVIVLIVCYVVTFATEVTSNSATATLMMPILAQMAISLQVNPLLFMYPAALATSFAFMLPAATPPNAIVFSTGTVRVIDMFSCGLLLNILSVPILLMATATWGNALFHFDTMPVEFLRNSTAT